ncbi:MAG: hypothetical protein SF069_12915 [Phycisphaerae bacterium]|nr:hypothetical protein [Phycisphaerae bacterium]
MSTSKSRMMIAFLAAGFLSGAASADLARRHRNADPRLIDDPYYFRVAPLDPRSLGATPKLETNRSAVQSVAASPAAAGQSSWLGMRVRGAVTAAQSTQTNSVYSAGIRSTLVSWNAFAARPAPTPPPPADTPSVTDPLIDGTPMAPPTPAPDYVPPEGNTNPDTIVDLIPPTPPGNGGAIPSPESSMLALIGLAMASLFGRRR